MKAELQTLKEDYEHLHHPFQRDGFHATPNNSVEIGTTLHTDQPVRIPIQQYKKHLLEAGKTGQGKSTKIKKQLLELNQKTDASIWIFDTENEYRNLNTHPSVDDDFIVVPWEKIRVNPLEPPQGVDSELWLQTFKDLFGEATGLVQSRGSLHKKLLDYKRKASNTSCNGDLYKFKNHLQRQYENIRNLPRPKADFHSRIERNIETYCTTGKQNFHVEKGIPISELADHNIIFELSGLDIEVKRLLTEILVYKHYIWMQENHGHTDQFRHLNVFDEAVEVFPREKEDEELRGDPLISKYVRRSRKYGIGNLAADQEPSKLTNSLLTNPGTKAVFPLGAEWEETRLTGAMGLDDVQIDWMREKLGVGKCLLYDEERGSVPVDLHNVELDSLSDEQVAERFNIYWKDFLGSVESIQ